MCVCVCVCSPSVDLCIPQELEVLMIVCETLEVSRNSACFGVEYICSKPGCHIVNILLYIISFFNTYSCKKNTYDSQKVQSSHKN